MLMSRDFQASTVRGIGIVESPEGLSGIHDAENAAVLWDRRPTPRFQTWIDTLSPDRLPEVRVILQPDTIYEALQAVFEACATPDCVESKWLLDDITALAAHFTDIMSARYLRLRLNVVTGDSCRKFHKDAIRARLICTYRGAGTQYGQSLDGADPQHIGSAPTGAPIVLRGSLWPETPDSGLLHRSPPIEGTGETRLLLVLDPIDDPEDET